MIFQINRSKHNFIQPEGKSSIILGESLDKDTDIKERKRSKKKKSATEIDEDLIEEEKLSEKESSEPEQVDEEVIVGVENKKYPLNNIRLLDYYKLCVFYSDIIFRKSKR